MHACDTIHRREYGRQVHKDPNRVFLLEFDTGAQAIARIPTSLSGPAHYGTASEVATMDFLRLHLGFPIPRILAWSSHAAETEVGAEFILMEKAHGVVLSDIYPGLNTTEMVDLAKKMATWDTKLRDVRFQFNRYGSLYYKRDVAEKYHAIPLLEDVLANQEINSLFVSGRWLDKTSGRQRDPRWI